MGVAMPSCGTLAALISINPWMNQDLRDSVDYSVALAKALSEMWDVLLLTGIIGIILACLCYRRQRKYGLPWTVPWMAFVLLFGVPAYLGYLFHRSWPARLPCPSCGQPAPRDRSACLACGRDFPPPALKGIEVFLPPGRWPVATP